MNQPYVASIHDTDGQYKVSFFADNAVLAREHANTLIRDFKEEKLPSARAAFLKVVKTKGADEADMGVLHRV